MINPEDEVLLENKNAVVYGAGGAIGAAVASAFAREGARVFLAGRTRATLDKVGSEISALGGIAEVAEVDALDEGKVEEHAAAITRKVGGLDISMADRVEGDIQAAHLPGDGCGVFFQLAFVQRIDLGHLCDAAQG